ncbi:MAG TPA: rhomboid family intramembrane serine protease [Planctomycetota bacterium]|nr:rhomboid family intramembrane serine protease [Planctomycetota bacterium]
MRRLLREPVTLGLVLLCIGWTVAARVWQATPLAAGALTGARLWEGEYWRLFSAMVLHHTGSWIHLVANAVSLFFVGRVIERGCGWRVLLGCVVGGALLGSAASLLWNPEPRVPRMGISGGIAGLVGLLLAVEWAISRGFLDFLKQRNTLLILFFVALSLPIAMLVESRVPTIQVDHAGHVGGFAFGLLFGVSYYTRKGIRTARGAAVALALAVLPVAYASHPAFEPEYRIWRARRAYGQGDLETAAREYERAKELDPAALDAAGMRAELLDTYLRLAAGRFGTPDGADFVRKALAVGGRDPGPWIRFAEAAEKAQRPTEAYAAWREAAGQMPDEGAWMAYERALRLLLSREAAPIETIVVARGATRGLRVGLPPEAALALEREIAAAADGVGARLGDHTSDRESATRLSELYWLLAENSLEDGRRPRYRLRSAEWLWRGSGEVRGDVRARFGAVITEAALYGDPAAGEEAARWFRERGLPVPEPDLEGEEGGG